MQTYRTGKLIGPLTGKPTENPPLAGTRPAYGDAPVLWSTGQRGRERVRKRALQEAARKPDAPRPPAWR